MSNADEQAFPVPGLSSLPNGDFIAPIGGLTKRECFAALAMQSFARLVPSCPAVTDEEARWIAQYSVKCADALLAELAKQ